MIALLLFFYWVILPIAGFRLARWLLRRIESLFLKGLVILGLLSFYSFFLWIAVGRNLWLDHQVRKMCAEYGGVKIYETVTLPRERFDKYGNFHMMPCRFAKPGAEYCFESEDYYYRKSPESLLDSVDLIRFNNKVIRLHDKKILGEDISFARRGGGLPVPWHPSAFSCPERPSGLFQSIFIMEEE